MRFIIVVFIQALTCFQTTGQTYYNRIYDFNFAYDEFISHREIQGSLFCVGASFELNGFNYALYSLIDSSGNPIWHRKYHYTTPDYGGVIGFHSILLHNGTIVANGAMADTSEYGTDIFLHAFSQQGDSLWFQNLDAGYNDRPTKMLLDDDGGILLLGY